MFLTSALMLAMATPGATNYIFKDGFDDDCAPNPSLTRLMVSDLGYTGDGSDAIEPEVDLTSYDNLWGHFTIGDATVPWPGNPSSAPLIVAFGRHQYLAAKFHVPEGIARNLWGSIQVTDYNSPVNMVSSISTRCGDFQPASLACQQTTAGAPFPRWSTAPSGNQCLLTPGTDYYLNVKLADPSQSTAGCHQSDATCPLGTANSIGTL